MTDAWGFPQGAWHGTGEAVKFQQTTEEKDAERDLKWARMLHPTKGFSGVPTAVLKRRWRKGVPRGWRRAAGAARQVLRGWCRATGVARQVLRGR